MSMLRVHILTLFPEFFKGPLESSIMGRSQSNGHVAVEITNIRDFAENKHNRIDDVPFGGGGGMVMQAGPVVRAIEHARQKDPELHMIQLSPKGRPFNQRIASELSEKSALGFVCGHYEGIDARVEGFMDDSISLGDFVLTGGEIGTLAILDAVTRLREGVLGNPESALAESHTGDFLLEHPHFTRPRSFRGMEVPEVLLSGNHGEISKWRRQMSVIETARLRPDLISKASLSGDEIASLRDLREKSEENNGKKT